MPDTLWHRLAYVLSPWLGQSLPDKVGPLLVTLATLLVERGHDLVAQYPDLVPGWLKQLIGLLYVVYLANEVAHPQTGAYVSTKWVPVPSPPPPAS